MLEKNTSLSSLDLNNDLKINQFHLLLHDIYTFQENVIIGYTFKVRIMVTMSSIIQKLLNDVLLSTPVLYARFEV